MANILFATIPFSGHVNPGIPLARALISRGHAIRWYSGEGFRGKISSTGAQFFPIVSAPDYDEKSAESLLEDEPKWSLAAHAFYYIKNVFYRPMPAYYRDLQAVDRDFNASLIVTDEWFTGAIPFAEKQSKAWISYGNSPVMYISRNCPPLATSFMPDESHFGRNRDWCAYHVAKVVFHGIQKYINSVRRETGLPDLQDFFINHNYRIARLHLKFNTPAFEFPLKDLPPAIRFVGPMIHDDSRACSLAWMDKLDRARPIVLVTQGSYAIADVRKLLIPSLMALKELGLQAVVSTGSQPASIIPDECRWDGLFVEEYVPYSRILPLASLMITNGGFGGVATALLHGVPLVIGGDSQDKPVVAARVMYTGCGVNLRTGKPSVRALRNAILEVLRNESYRNKAQEIGRDFASRDALKESVCLIEQALPAA